MRIHQGSLVCVGTGISIGGQITVLAKSEIENADIVFIAMNSQLMENWITQINSNIHNLQQYYAEGKYRPDTYQEMAEAIMEAVRDGKRVCAAFYGHPGIFACVAHLATDIATGEGFDARIEPGVSADACLYADLGIDPGNYGCQAFEASQFIFNLRKVDLSAYLILWQIGLAGEATLTRFDTDENGLQLMVDSLIDYGYSQEHEIILYEAATLPIEKVRADKIKLKHLPKASVSMKTTMVVPPAMALQQNTNLLKRMAAISA